ncbi:MAG: ribose 5-phosphate isomerase B [Candidatus Omnitrophica bacterium]|nr:ribose 5-phosphate isomerase B [Candidatus Omnitrophota bacterium]
MKIAIGSDHRGINLKKALILYLQKNGHQVEDFGTYSPESCDYPQIALKVGRTVAKKKVERGILICGSGLGMTMAAGTVKGVRAANCLNLSLARFSREHNDANVLVLGAMYVGQNLAKRIAGEWLKTPFSGKRHLRRIKMFSK